MYKINTFLFGERILPECHTRDVELPNSTVRPMKFKCGVFNKVFLVNHWRDILNCRYVTENHDFCFPLRPFTQANCLYDISLKENTLFTNKS